MPLAVEPYMSRCSGLSHVVNLLVLSVFTHADCTDVSSACRLCVPESAARRVMEHALLNDESEYSGRDGQGERSYS